jgi:hypothetical protein
MYLLYTDETNTDPKQSDFFVYGGVAVKTEEAADICNHIAAIRTKYRYGPGDLLKFNTKQRPTHVTPDAHRAVKQELMQMAAKYDVKLFSSMVLFDIAGNCEKGRRFGINSVCAHFHRFLERRLDFGLMLIDTFKEAELREIIKEKWAVGLKDMPYSKTMGLTRILGYHVAMISSSHLCSLTDIILGALGCVINYRQDESKAELVSTLVKQIVPFCIMENGRVSDWSLFFSPKVIKAPPFLSRYQHLKNFFGQHGLPPLQPITDERYY